MMTVASLGKESALPRNKHSIVCCSVFSVLFNFADYVTFLSVQSAYSKFRLIKTWLGFHNYLFLRHLGKSSWAAVVWVYPPGLQSRTQPGYKDVTFYNMLHPGNKPVENCGVFSLSRPGTTVIPHVSSGAWHPCKHLSFIQYKEEREYFRA